MKVCMDGLSLSRLKGTGLYACSHVLCCKLFELYPQISFDLIWDGPTDPSLSRYPNVTFSHVPINRRDNDYSLLEDHLRAMKADIFHSPDNGFSIPRQKECPMVMTVHDLSPMSTRQITDKLYSQKFSARFPQALETSDRIIAVSKFMKSELLKYYPVPEKKIEVIYPWCPESFKVMDPEMARDYLKDHYQIDGQYILYAGTLHVRKNLDVLVRAFKGLVRQRKDISLLIAGSCEGKRREYYLSLKELIKSLDLEDRVRFLGLVPYEDMPFFYNCCECTVNLSCYEGFPMTAIEAVACGSPLVCIRTSFFNEIAGSNAHYLDSLDDRSLCALLLKIIDENRGKCRSNNEHYLDSMKQYGISAAKKLVRIYETISRWPFGY